MKPSEQLKIRRTQELTLTPAGDQQVQVYHAVELTQDAVESGFLKDLPGAQLSVYLYLLTHIQPDFSLTTTPTVIASLVPYTPSQVESSLRLLSVQGFVKLEDHSDGSYTITLGRIPGSPEVESADRSAIDLEQEFTSGLSSEEPTSTLPNDAVSYILRQKAFSEEDLVRAITGMIPSQMLTPNFRQEVDYWFKTFDKEVIKELVRRTDEARQRDSELNYQAYLRKVANEWIQEQIFTIEDLAASDKLYRETRSLIEEFGIDRQKEITRTHWETISRWLNSQSENDFALSMEVARFAVQSAIMRKSDGRPSLAYIEDNYIKPFKENKIKTVEEAREFLQRQRMEKPAPSNAEKTQKQAKPQTKWQAGIDFTRFREN